MTADFFSIINTDDYERNRTGNYFFPLWRSAVAIYCGELVPNSLTIEYSSIYKSQV